MHAYVFWHQPRPETNIREYEHALRDFHEALGRVDAAAGFVASESHRITGAGWLPEGTGYEDWYLIASSAALDALERAAVSVHARATHDRIARMSASGVGGLYRLMRAQDEDLEPDSPAPDVAPAATSVCIWVSKPEGWEEYGEFHDDLQRLRPAESRVWQRQMVLGPAPEYAVIVPEDCPLPEFPESWSPMVVRRIRVDV